MITILGAGGHGRVIGDVLDMAKVEYEYIEGEFVSAVMFIIAVGDNKTRAKLFENAEGEPVTVHHPLSIISPSVQIGKGTFINAGVIINDDVVIGDNVILNSGCIIEHHCKIADHVHIAPGATVCGEVEIGEGALVGANSAVLSNVPEWSTVRAGSLYPERSGDERHKN